MLPLDSAYLAVANDIATGIQNSEELAAYLEEEEEAVYDRLKDQFEPRIHNLHEQVSNEDPLQIIALEQRLMQADFEGLFLPRMLGYSVLRGELNDQVKFVRPQDHFKDVLMAICNSANFEILKKRIGQSIQIGFAQSSDIWITNLINLIDNKKVRYFLQSQKLDKYRSPEGRSSGLKIYKKQFQGYTYMVADFPKSFGELKVMWSELKEFLIYRVEKKLDNSSLLPYMRTFVENEDFKGHDEHIQIMAIYANFFDLGDEDAQHLATHLNHTRQVHKNFNEIWLQTILELHISPRVDLDLMADARVYNVLDKEIDDELTDYYNLMATVHSAGYFNDESIEAVKNFYNQHPGRSTINECVRMTIYHYFARLLSHLEVADYHELFESSKIYSAYIKIFGNEHFNQAIKDLSMKFVNKTLKHFTDKRGKDYQDIKKFVSNTFQDLNFLHDKDVVEIFKTRRKRKAVEEKKTIGGRSK